MGERAQLPIHGPLVLALWIALSSTVVLVWVLWPNGIAVDYAVFWRAVRVTAPYAPTAEPFAYPPTALLWFAPLRWVSFWAGYWIWIVTSIVLFSIAARRLYGARPAALAILSPAISIALIPGQSALIAGAGLLAAFALRSAALRGILIGAVLTFKPQLVIFAPLFLLMNRDWVALVATIASAALITLMTTALFGLAIWTEWLTAIPHFQQVVIDRGLSMSAVSPGAFGPILGLPTWPLVVIGSVAGMWIAVRGKSLPAAQTAALVAVASLLAAPYALRYDLAAVAPLMAAVILSETGRRPLIACVGYSATFGPLSLLAAAFIGLRRQH